MRNFDPIFSDAERRHFCFTGIEEAGIGAYLAAAASVASVAGTVVAVSAAQDQASAASSAAATNSAIAAQNSQIALQQGQIDEANQQRQLLVAVGSERAGYGASGVTSDGSPMDVLGSSASNGELDRQTILYKAQLKSMGYADQASLDSGAAANALVQGNEKSVAAGLAGLSKTATQGYGLLNTKSGNTNTQDAAAAGDDNTYNLPPQNIVGS
jgi:hypothetical protein